ncbi:tetratricopeptide repeat protein [Sphingobacterium bambusae]|uniref:Tetratricopeptide repeat protein n=1 Tax=Sphingobacterium bambusae TaxID=662858 RepID=A0ABW6BCB1_9SPHI|nr:hypothetical protein [Sphingobacterium bambusae]WPL48456.1 hypothetical protein SCB77_21135 [Sphingobacterium bambusae]
MMIETVFAKVLGIPFVTDLLKATAALGYKQMKERNNMHKILAEHGLAMPTDDTRSLYIHALILLNAQISDHAYAEILIKEDSFAVFRNIERFNDNQPFKTYVIAEICKDMTDRNLRVQSEFTANKIIDQFFAIYDSLLRSVASPVQNTILNKVTDLGNKFDDGQALIFQKLEELKEDSPVIKKQIQHINRLIEERNLQLALDSLLILADEIGRIKSVELKSTILTNIGYVYHDFGNRTEANSYFKRAYDIDSQNFAVICNYSQALASEGNTTLAVQLLDLAIEIHGENKPQIWEAYVLVNRSALDYAELKSRVPFSLLDRSTIKRALAIVCRVQELYDEYKTLLQEAFHKDPDNREIKLSYLESVLFSYQTDYKIFNMRAIDDELAAKMEREILFIEHAIALELDNTYGKLVFWHAKIILLYILRREDEGLGEFAALERIYSLEQHHLYRTKVVLLLVKQDFKAAGALMNEFYLKFGLLEDLMMSFEIAGNANDMDAVKIHLRSIIASEDRLCIFQAYLILIQCYHRQAELGELAHLLDELRQYTGTEFRILEAKIHVSLNLDTATEIIRTCEEAITTETTFSTFNLFMEVLEQAELWNKLGNYLQERLGENLQYNMLTDRLVIALEKSGNVRKLLDLLYDLRSRLGIHVRYTLKEVSFLADSYRYQEAISLANEYVGIYSERLDIEFFIVTTQFQIEDFGAVDAFLERNFDVKLLNKVDLNNYLALLASRGLTNKCVEVLYDYHRDNYSPYSNDLYLTFFLKYGLSSCLTKPDRVQFNTFVRLYDGIREHQDLVVISPSTDAPILARNEISADDPFLLPLLGQQIGFQFEDNSEFIPKSWSIVSIENIFLYQYRKCQKDAASIFKQKGAIKVFHFDDITKLINSSVTENKEWQDPYLEIFSFYENFSAGIGTLSEALEESIMEIRTRLRSNRMQIIVSLGTAAELKGLDIIANDVVFIFDITFILTLLDLGLFDKVVTSGLRISISRSTYLELREGIERKDFKIDVSNQSPILESIRTYVTILDPDMTLVNSIERRQGSKNIGKSLYDSAVLAKQLGALLMSDEYFARVQIASNLKMEASWIVPFLKFLAKGGLLDENELHEITLELISLNYRFVDFNEKTMLCCLAKDNFNVSQTFLQLLSLLSGGKVSIEGAVSTVDQFIVLLATSQSIDADRFYELCDLVLSFLFINRGIHEVISQFRSLLEMQAATRERGRLIFYILNKYIAKFSIKPYAF